VFFPSIHTLLPELQPHPVYKAHSQGVGRSAHVAVGLTEILGCVLGSGTFTEEARASRAKIEQRKTSIHVL
jgi:hypothetical protein